MLSFPYARLLNSAAFRRHGLQGQVIDLYSRKVIGWSMSVDDQRAGYRRIDDGSVA